MSKQVTTSSPKLSIGLDIHKKSWKFQFDTDIGVGKGHSFPPDVDKVYQYVCKHFPDYQVSIAYEVGCCGYEPARKFISFGWDTFVVNPADIPRPAKNNFVKTDKIDARNIARQLRAGLLKKLTIPDRNQETLRSLTRQRTALVRNFRRVKSRVKSMLLYYQIKIPEGMDTAKWPKRFLKWLDELQLEHTTQKRTLKSMLSQYRFLDQEIKSISTDIRAYCKKNLKEDYQLLRSVPGIAGLTAGYLLAELGDIKRFNSLKRLASYVGFVPGLQQSGDTIYTTGCTPRANRHVRNLIVEAAWIAIRVDPAMQNYYRTHAGKNAKAAIFKVGRKLLSRILAVIKNQTPYSIGVIQ